MTGTLAPGASATYGGDANLGEVSPKTPQYYPVTFSIDPNGQMPESNNNNNTLTGCYNLAQQTYINGPCPRPR